MYLDTFYLKCLLADKINPPQAVHQVDPILLLKWSLVNLPAMKIVMPWSD
jgi:hypothetical protein